MKLIATHLMAFAIGVLGTMAYQVKAQQVPMTSAPAPAQKDPMMPAKAPTAEGSLSKAAVTTGGIFSETAKVKAPQVSAKPGEGLTVRPVPIMSDEMLGLEPAPPVNRLREMAVDLLSVVPNYRNPDSVMGRLNADMGRFGGDVVCMYREANKESLPKAKIVKTKVCDNLQNEFTCRVLGQDKLHVPEYTDLIRETATSLQVGSQHAVEAIEQERLADEAAIEALANPSMWQRLKWWWNS